MTQSPESVARILWSGTQWRVTTSGIDEICPEVNTGYWAAVSDLDGDWIVRIASKPWVDVDDLTTAFLIACVSHGIRIENVVERIDEARRVSAAVRRCAT